MAIFYGDSNFLPKAITATTVKMLHRKIRKLQLDTMSEYRFISFYFDGKEHVAWYYTLLDENEIIREGINGTSNE